MRKFLEKLSVFKRNPFAAIALVAIIVQILMFVLFYSLPDPLGLSLAEMYSGKTIWQVFMAFGAILVLVAIFGFFKAPRALALFLGFYFVLAIADYEVFRFSHQRLSYSFLRTYFHLSNITDETTVSTLGGDLKGTILWLSLLFSCVVSSISFVIVYTLKLRKGKLKKAEISKPIALNKKLPICFFSVGMILSLVPLILFLAGTRGIVTVPIVNMKIDMRFTLGKHTLTAPVLHIAAVETFEFIRDNAKITDKLVSDLDSFLPQDFIASRKNVKEFPTYREAPSHEYIAKKPYNIILVMGESYKGRIFNQMLQGDTNLAPNLWKLATGRFLGKGGGLWFKNAFSGGYPTVRGTMATYLGFPSHPNRDVPSFYASNHFTGFPEYLTNYKKAYMTISNPVFDHTLPFVEKFYGDNWEFPGKAEIEGTTDSIGVDFAIKKLESMPTDSPWFLSYNTISSHIPFYGYPDAFASKPEDAMERYRNAIRYTDQQFGRFLLALAKRSDLENTVILVLGDHDTPVDSIDYAVPQPLGVATTQVFMGIFSADTSLFKGLEIRNDVASQLDIGPTIFDLAQVRPANHFWGYDLLAQKRPLEQPAVFFSQNAYYLGFPDYVLTGGLENEEVYKGVNGTFSVVTDSLSHMWRKKAIGASRVVRSLLRNDKMQP